MRESSTYQYILDEGRAEGLVNGNSARPAKSCCDRPASASALRRPPRRRPSRPSRIWSDWSRMGDRVLTAGGWQELLAVT